MSDRPIKPVWEEVSFQDIGLDARALVTRTDKNGIITFASKAYRELSCYSKSELVGRSHNIIRHPFMPKIVFKKMWEAIKTGKHFSGIVMNMRKDGKYYWVEVRIDAIDTSGNIISSLSSVGEGAVDKSSEEIAGYVAIRREPTRKEINEAIKVYKKLKKQELEKKVFLNDREKEVMKVL